MEGPLSEASPQRATDLKDALEALPFITSDTRKCEPEGGGDQRYAGRSGEVFAGGEAEELVQKRRNFRSS